MRCLIIDDDESPRLLICRLISHSGHQATAVDGYQSAISAVRGGSFDVAIVDMELPDVSGENLIARLRAEAPDMRLLVVSGYGDRRHVLAALDAGADGYLLKDELGSSLANSLQEIRAGHTPLSARVASIVLRQLRFRRLGSGPVSIAHIRGTDKPS